MAKTVLSASLFAWACALAPATAGASCLMATLATFDGAYDAPAGGCTIGNLSFSDFLVEDAPGLGVVQLDPKTITLVPIAGGLGIAAAAPLAAAAGATLARVINAVAGGAIAIPTPPRTDLLPLVTYAPPVAAPGTAPGPVADLLRLNTGVAPTAPAGASRLGLLGGDPAGYPNGRRLFDDVVDIALRVVAGALAAPPFSTTYLNTHLGDAVNVNDAPYRTTFPYHADAPSGRHRRHIDPGEAGCTGGGGAPCVP